MVCVPPDLKQEVLHFIRRVQHLCVQEQAAIISPHSTDRLIFIRHIVGRCLLS